MKANKDIRDAVEDQGFKLWELAEALKIQDTNLSKKLRRELSSEEKAHIFRVIAHMAEQKKEAIR